MNSRDRRLGMDRAITRRDFLSGVGTAASVSLLPACARTAEPTVESAAAYFPPDETGMRGSHPGSFETAHATVQGSSGRPRDQTSIMISSLSVRVSAVCRPRTYTVAM